MSTSMTNLEVNQADRTIIEAGRTAYMIGIVIGNNPYRKNQRMQKLWSIGHRQGSQQDASKKSYNEPLVTEVMCHKCGIVNTGVCLVCEDEFYVTELEEK